MMIYRMFWTLGTAGLSLLTASFIMKTEPKTYDIAQNYKYGIQKNKSVLNGIDNYPVMFIQDNDFKLIWNSRYNSVSP